MTDVHIVGAGIHAFGRHADKSGLDQGVEATQLALSDAGLSWKQMQFGFGGSQAAGSADAVLLRLGLTGMPFVNVANYCATGGSSLLSAYRAIRSGDADLGVVIGFDKHARGAFNFFPEEVGLPSWYGELGLMQPTQFFAMKIRRYMHDNGISQRSLCRVVEKATANGALAPHAWRRTPLAIDQIASGKMVSDPLNQYMFCSPAEGGVALILASAKKMRELGLSGPRLLAATIRTRMEDSFEVFQPSSSANIGPSPVQLASAAAYEMAGVSASDIDVAQVQDTDAGAEIMHYAENGFCKDGDQERLLADGATRIGGAMPINTDGGCIACGEPIGATGLRQVYENVLQLRGNAGDRQIEGVRTAYSQVNGMPGVAAVTIIQN